MEKAAAGRTKRVNNQGGRHRHTMRPPCSSLFLGPLGLEVAFRSIPFRKWVVSNFSKKTNNPNPSPIGKRFGLYGRGARGGSRTRTPLRALAPEASESTNSTTRASCLRLSCCLVQCKRDNTTSVARCQQFLQKNFLFYLRRGDGLRSRPPPGFPGHVKDLRRPPPAAAGRLRFPGWYPSR